jgi:pyruvate dehydrogenase E2 component (dihydrolipoamide acetyltransferase)
MIVTLTSDHRVVYGAHAAAFLAHLRTLLETPLSLLV